MAGFFEGSFWYLGPFAYCKNQYAGAHPDGQISFPLPFDNLPQTDGEDESEEKDQSVLPPDGWQATFACFWCGLVEVYTSDDIDCSLVLKESEGVFHNDGVCMCVEVQCVDRYCKTPARWYVDISGATENDLRQRLQRRHFFGKLPCGHEIRTTLDTSSFRIYRVMNRLWETNLLK